MTRLIGLAGLSRSGKDTAYEIIKRDNPDLSVARMAFADKIKEYASGVLDIPRERYDEFKLGGHVQVTTGPKPSDVTVVSGREFLQNLGHLGREHFGEDFWVNQILPSPDLAEGWGGIDPRDEKYASDILVVTDVRYTNEAVRIRMLGGEVWRIERDTSTSDGHPSEEGIGDEYISAIIRNNGSEADFARDIKFQLTRRS